MSLRTRFVLSFGLGSIIFLLVITILIFNRTESAMESQLKLRFQTDVHSRIVELNNIFTELGKDFQLAARLPLFRSMRFHQLTLNQPALKNDVRQIELYFMDLIHQRAEWSQVRYVNKQGIETFRVDRSGIKHDLIDMSQDKTVMKMLELKPGDFRITEDSFGGKVQNIIWWKPIGVSSGVGHGVISFSISYRFIMDAVRQLVTSEAEAVCLVDAQGTVLLSNNSKKTCEPQDENLWQITEKVALPGLSWILTLTVNPDVFLVDVKKMKMIVFGVIFPVVALFSFGFTLIFSNRFVHAISQLVDASRIMGHGEQFVPIKLNRNDELGELAKELNRSGALIEANRSRLEELVEERTTELVAINKELEAFAYSVSHDLRAPLRHIDGFSQALLEDYEDKLDDEGKDYLRELGTSATQMGELIDSLLDLSRITRKEMELEQIDLRELVLTVVEDLRKAHPERKVVFDIEEAPYAKGDLNLMGILIRNLLENAWKYSEKNSDAKIEFGSKQEGGNEVFYVRDNGVGFNMEYYDKLFGAFQRLHAETEFKGIGIGLATVQRIINRHGGRIWAEGQEDKGATFYFTLKQERYHGQRENHTIG